MIVSQCSRSLTMITLRDSIDKTFALDQSVDLLRKLTGELGAEAYFNGLSYPTFPRQ